MSKNLSRLFLISSLCLVAFGLFVAYATTRPFSSSAIQPAARAGDLVKEIAGHRDWSKVNPEPQLMPDRTAALCAPVTALPIDESKNPHHNKYLTVYVNDLGRTAMFEQLNPKFPEGSVIVKEKLADKSSPTPELMTVMVKRGRGFNPDSGDWEYMIVDGTGTKVTAQGKLENCQSCHSARQSSGYVFRTYLPNAVLSKLK